MAPLRRPASRSTSRGGARFTSSAKSFSRKGGVTEALKNLEKARGQSAHVKVGLPVGSNEYPDGTSVIMVGIIHEFGEPSLGIPMRSFLRAAVHEKTPEIKALIHEIAKSMKEPGFSKDVALGKLGAAVAGMVQAKIIEGPFEPIKPATIAARKRRSGKASTAPLQDTGHLKQSITWAIDREGSR